jgi:hypothetical protein
MLEDGESAVGLAIPVCMIESILFNALLHDELVLT